jgi:hypothetical protein
MDNRQDVTNDAVLEDQFAEQHIVWAIAQDVSDGKDGLLVPGNLVGLQGPIHFDAVLKSCCQWLLAHNVQSTELCQLNNHFPVHLIQDADKDSVDSRGHVFLTPFDTGPAASLVSDEFAPVCENGTIGRRSPSAPYHGLAKVIPLVVIWLSNRDQHAVA